MQKLTYIIVALLLCSWLLCSCGWHTFENGHRVPGPPASRGDSVLTLPRSNPFPVPDSAVVISHLVVKAPCPKIYDYAEIEAVARHEAARVGGNLMKVNIFHSATRMWLRQGIYATVYRLSEPGLARLQQQLDSVDRHHADSIKNIAIVHIKDLDDGGKRVIYFNDSVMVKIHGTGYDGFGRAGRKDLVFERNGVLRIGLNTFDHYGSPDHRDIEVGKEYFGAIQPIESQAGSLFLQMGG